MFWSQLVCMDQLYLTWCVLDGIVLCDHAYETLVRVLIFLMVYWCYGCSLFCIVALIRAWLLAASSWSEGCYRYVGFGRDGSHIGWSFLFAIHILRQIWSCLDGRVVKFYYCLFYSVIGLFGTDFMLLMEVKLWGLLFKTSIIQSWTCHSHSILGRVFVYDGC